MRPFSAAQLALNQLLHQRLRDAHCHHGHLEVSVPGPCLSLSGKTADGNTLFFWEFSCPFHQLVGAYLSESFDEHTAQLTIQVDVANAEFRYASLTRQQQATQAAAEAQQAAERRRALAQQVTGRPAAQ